MKIASPKLFYFSLASLITAFVISHEFHEAVATAVTRDFNFSEPLTYGLIVLQACISLAGVLTALNSKDKP